MTLIGRRAERDTLDRFVEAVRSGESRALVVSGEAALGKTALLEYLAEQAAECRVLRATGSGKQPKPPALNQRVRGSKPWRRTTKPIFEVWTTPGRRLCVVEQVGEMTAHHAVRAITGTHRRGATVCEVRTEAADTYHRKMYAQGESLRHYLADLNGHVPTYYRNSQGDSTYVRPSGFFEASRGNRKFPLDDYRYEVAVEIPSQTELAAFA